MTESSAASAGPGAGEAHVEAVHDPAYRQAVVELLGAIAYGELSAFERLVEDAKMAPGIDDKIANALLVKLNQIGTVTETLTGRVTRTSARGTGAPEKRAAQ